MNKTIKGIISLSAATLVVAVMLGALFWQRNREPEIEEDISPAFNPVVRLVHRTEEELTRVTFTDAYGTVAMLPYTDENNWIQWRWEGVDYPTVSGYIRNKIRGAFSLFTTETIHEDIADAPGLNLADFGLDPPLMTITGYYTDGTTLNIYLGGLSGDFAGHFIMVEDNPGLHLITRSNGERFLLGLEDVLDTSLPVWTITGLEYVLIDQRGRETVEFETQPHAVHEGLYTLIMQQPIPGRDIFSESFHYHVLERIEHFAIRNVVNIHPVDFSPYGLDDPSLEFIYRAQHGEAHLLFGDQFFKDIDGSEVAFIYVRFADRPHVFEVRYELVSPLFNVNSLRFIDRFILLLNIQDVERMEVSTPDGDFDIRINHVEGDTTDIEPTINGIPVDVSDFRLTYRLIIGLGMDSEVDPFTPRGAPLYTVRYTMFEDDDVILTFYQYDPNFLGVSVNGEQVWFVTSRRGFDIFMTHLNGLID